MSETPTQLTTEDVASLAGITPASVRRYRLRGAIPEPDEYVGRTPVWHPATIEAWLEARAAKIPHSCDVIQVERRSMEWFKTHYPNLKGHEQ